MKAKLLSILGLGAIACFPGLVGAQPYSLTWFTIDGGGGTSTGAAYSVNGTIGQPDTAVLSAGPYSLAGGFWSAFSGPDTSGPRLFIVRSGANCIISWSPATPGFILQSTPSLGPAAWTDEPTGSSNPAMVPTTGAARFYRLRKP